jgi:hypothetical protein
MIGLRLLATTLCFLASSIVFAADLPRAKPEEVGMSSERLARIAEVLKADIAAGRIPGAVIAIARHGRLVALDAYRHHLQYRFHDQADDDGRRADAV